MRDIRYLRSADDGLLVSFEAISFDELHGLAAGVRTIDGVEAAIVGHSSILVLSREPLLGAIRQAIDALVVRGVTSERERNAARHAIDVDFSPEHSPDFPLLLELTSRSTEELLARIATLEFRARYLGFLPGFAYLEGWPEEWSLPRRAEARDRVPSGSFAIAGTMAGIYPHQSPGGWNILGRTGATLWSPDVDPPNMIAAGDIVTIRRGPFALETTNVDRGRVTIGAEPVAEVVAPGVATFVVGASKLERYRFGLAPGGAFDEPSMRLANRLVGNADGAMLLECAAVGPRIRFTCDTSIAMVGAVVAATMGGKPLPMRARVDVAKGSTLDVGPIRGGMRTLIAVRGGLFDTSPRWSERPHRIIRGDLLYGTAEDEQRVRLAPMPSGDRLEIAVTIGPHELNAMLIAYLFDREWIVTPSLDRIGVRLSAGAPPGELPALLPSCGMRIGTVQWHPGGELVVMGPDHPITGGYLQPVTVTRTELWKVAQLTPGDRVRFVKLGS